MVKDMPIGLRRRQEVAATVLPSDEWGQYINQSSDVAGFLQLFFHAGCAAVGACVIHYSLAAGSIPGLVVGELMLGFVSSFYFAGFHEFIHNTAFRSKWINKALAHVMGVFIFRGANWFWCFHWLHHRYTQDPEKDPELSGGSSDLADPSRSILMYIRFLTGWPFGLERTVGMAKMALGWRIDPWVQEAGMEEAVRVEAGVHVLIYVAFVCAAIFEEHIRAFVIWYWVLPHILGAGHLRFYQFAEHRACESGTYTDLDAWGAARTTATWWFYKQLAWNMPFHIEHHAWPAIPFHLLPVVHERIKDSQPKNRCLISGDAGYIAIHLDFLRRMWHGEDTALEEVKPETKADAVSNTWSQAKNRLADPEAMGKLPLFTMAEVEKHSTKTNCWVVVKGIVIDATHFLPDHPGGEMVIVGKAGQDASKMFKMIHPDGTLERHLPDSCIVGKISEAGTGKLDEPLLAKSSGQS